MPKLGVIVGRFQVPMLHEGHMSLINRAASECDRVLIVVGTTDAIYTRRNPLQIKEVMTTVVESLPENYIDSMIDGSNRFDITIIKDHPSDSYWSENLDTLIRESTTYSELNDSDVVLYGSRNSFINSYSGSFKTIEIEPTSLISSSLIRKEISNTNISSAEFRRGIIYATQHNYPIALSTVDVILYDITTKNYYFGRKIGENKNRLIGGFIDVTDESVEAAARREVLEETNIKKVALEYLGSKKINDFRYQNMFDRSVITHVYLGFFHSEDEDVKPLDDIFEIKTFPIREVLKENNYRKILNKSHAELFELFGRKNIVKILIDDK